ncbi:MAG: ABC transporter transmembrane domain-containing protein [Acetivibrionales bacterium]
MCKINNKCKYNDIRIIKKALFYLNPYKFKFFVSVALTVTAMFLATLQPFMFGRFIDYIGLKDKYLINKTLLAMGAVFLAQLILGLFYNYLMAIVANNVEVDVRKKVFNSIFAMQVQVFNKSKKGEFFTTFDEDVKVFSNMLTQKILIFIDIGTALFIGLILFKINWILALILLVMFPVSLAIQYFNGKKLRDKEKELKFERVNFFTFIEEVLNGFTTIKMLGAEIRIKGKYFFHT